MSSKVLLVLLLFIALPAFSQTPTPGPNDCCQCVGVCALPSTGALCTVGCTAVYNANCTGLLTSCTTFTPTHTPTSTPTRTPTNTPTRTPTRTPTNTFRPTPVVCGDADGDGCTTFAECTNCNSHVGQATPVVCDCNGNGIITTVPLNEIVICLSNLCNTPTETPTQTPTLTATLTPTYTPTRTPSVRYQMIL